MHVDVYTEEERYALIVREVLKQHEYFLFCAKAVVFHTSSTGFTTLANKTPSWSIRMQRFLAHSLKFNCQFKMNKTPLCEQFEELNNCIVDKDIDEIDATLH